MDIGVRFTSNMCSKSHPDWSRHMRVIVIFAKRAKKKETKKFLRKFADITPL